VSPQEALGRRRCVPVLVGGLPTPQEDSVSVWSWLALADCRERLQAQPAQRLKLNHPLNIPRESPSLVTSHERTLSRASAASRVASGGM
jgi:hypothetical protein